MEAARPGVGSGPHLCASHPCVRRQKRDELAVVRPLAKGRAPTRTTTCNLVSWIPHDSSFPDLNHSPKYNNKYDHALAIQSHQGTSITDLYYPRDCKEYLQKFFDSHGCPLVSLKMICWYRSSQPYTKLLFRREYHHY